MPLHTLRLENCCAGGSEHELLEAVHTVVAFLSRLNRSAPSIVVEFPDRYRDVVKDCEYGDDEMTFLSRGVQPRAGKGCEIPNFKGSYLGRFALVLADFWTSDHLSDRSRP